MYYTVSSGNMNEYDIYYTIESIGGYHCRNERIYGNHQKINSTSRKNIRRGFWRSGGKNKNHYPVKKRAAINKPKNTICNKEMLLSKDTNIPTVWLE